MARICQLCYIQNTNIQTTLQLTQSCQLHNSASVWIVVAEEGSVCFMGVVIIMGITGESRIHVPNIPRGSPLVIHLSGVWIVNQMVRLVRPQFCFFPCLPHSLQYLVGVHVPRHRYLILFSLHFYRTNSFHGSYCVLHFSLASFTVHSNSQLHGLKLFTLLPVPGSSGSINPAW